MDLSKMTLDQMAAVFATLSKETLDKINHASEAELFDRYCERVAAAAGSNMVAEALAS